MGLEVGKEMMIKVDKLPIKRLDSIHESGIECFPSSDAGYDEKKVDLIRRIDFAWAVEREDPTKKQKKSSSKEATTAPLPWLNMIDDLKMAHQELSVIIDLINTVEANDAVTVASMTRPKPLANELLSDLAVSTATKLQSFRKLGKYFKQSAKALERQVAREARFYGALIRLQQNWKVKRHRVVSSAPGNEGFYIDLYDNSIQDSAVISRTSAISTVRIEHDPAGMLAVNLPPKSRRSLQFSFLVSDLGNDAKTSSQFGTHCSPEDEFQETKKKPLGDDECVKGTHLILRKTHRAIFDEQVFNWANREAVNPGFGVNITGLQDSFLQLSIGQGASVSISLVQPCKDEQTRNNEETQNVDIEMEKLSEGKSDALEARSKFPSQLSYEIYLEQTFHEQVLMRAKDEASYSGRIQPSNAPTKDGLNLLSNFCMSLAHRIFSNKVLTKLEKVVAGVSYAHLISHPTWHSRTSSWTLSVNIPEAVLHAGQQTHNSGAKYTKDVKSQFRTKVVVNDDCISIEGEGAPNVVSLFKKPESICSINRYDCDLADLPIILLEQIASQVIRWLHEEALMAGLKANRDYLCLLFEVEQGETLALVAHVDPSDTRGCISWWLVVDAGFSGTKKIHAGPSGGESDIKKFMGHLPLDVLYSTVMDLVNLCGGGGGGSP